MGKLHVYLDEAGYTGSDLANRDQPVFTLAGVSLSDEVAKDVAAKCFPDGKGKELRHSVLYFRKKGREQILAFLGELSKIPKSGSVSVMHKELILLGLLIDTWMVPWFKEQGANLYAKGANIGLKNLMFISLGSLLGEEGRREFARQFQAMMRDRTVFAYETFWDSVEDVARRAGSHPEIEELLLAFLDVGHHFGTNYLWRLPQDILDPADYAFMEAAGHWHEAADGPVVLTHDDSAALSRKKEFWETILSADAPPAITGMDRRTTRYPLNATLRFADSKTTLQLQLADIVAGASAVGWRKAAGATVKHPDYAEALKESGLMRPFVIGGMWRTTDVTPGHMGTEGSIHEDAQEYIAKLVAERKKKE